MPTDTASLGAVVLAAPVPMLKLGPPPKPKRRSFTTYDQAHAYLERRPNLERARQARVAPETFKLDRMRMLARVLGDPQQALRFVHIAGSKGKGSTVEMVSACLASNGYTTGVFTSPHLVDVRERIRINDSMISEDDFRRLMGRVAGAASGVAAKHGEATYFEVITALGLLYYAEQAVDIAVLEAGLGGRLDCTNIIEPLVTAVTEIQLEHTEILGSTLELIAAEKAGIFKAGAPAISVKQDESVIEIFRKKALDVGADLRVLGTDIEYSMRFESTPELGPHARVCMCSARSSFEHLAVPLRGEHQAPNCGLALAILDALSERGFEFTERAVARGLAKTPANGRTEEVWPSPKVLIDGAHNPASIKALVKAIGATIKYDSMVIIFGCAIDKDIEGMLREIELGADKLIFTKAEDNPRAAEPDELQRRFAEISPKMTQTQSSLKEAINIAAKAVNGDDLVLVTGSFYLAGEAKRMFLDKKTELEAED